MRQALIVDDHPFIREMVKIVLEKTKFEIVAETDNGAEALQLARKYVPHLMVLDLSMPKLDGLEVLNRLRILGLPIKVLVLTAKASDLYADRCMRAGANGFMEKSEDVGLLTKAVTTIMNGKTYMSGTSVGVSQNEGNEDFDGKLVASLSNRELRTLQHLASGMTNKQIAKFMLLSEKTVSTYKTRLMTKLNINSVVYLADFARRNHVSE
ncbi:DNA-binding response regulator, LuxR family [Pseudomonas synxantha]|uniref:DNA-binding response regulator, LuxR family n=1 Tax=Pseudomonas synxantha TaxID=47883 RepID=A0A3G7UCA2_9PSED|nr:response regulator transcription factor [Pseudomonas synxantha]AZE56841.1 DNA-binding response regulator, LuxR family [Pseudomonas synxantha]